MIRRLLIIITLLVFLLGAAGPPVSAADVPPVTQEDPAAAPQLYSSIALLRYYSASLDYMIQLDQPGSDTNLSKTPFADVPPELNQPVADFGSSGTAFTDSLVPLFGLWDLENQYVGQYRLQDASNIYDQIQAELPAATAQLTAFQSAVATAGAYLKIDSLSPQNQLAITYAEVTAKIQQLWNMLALLARSLLPEQWQNLTTNQQEQIIQSLTPEQLAAANINLTPGQITNLTPAQLNDLLNSLTPGQLATILNSLTPGQIAALLLQTQLTLEINPSTAFVGDQITFQGVLSAGGIPLAGREITILFNNAVLLTAQTGSSGQYGGTFPLPYLYVHTAQVQAIYYPTGSDAGTYLAAVSPQIQITVLFYEGQLVLQAGNPAYPGRDTALTGIFSYGDAPVPAPRAAGLYLDNNPLEDFNTGVTFNKNIPLDPQITSGEHMITVSAPADGRYAPVIGNCVINVTLAAVILDLNTPKISLIPGSITISGRTYSVIGPLNNASIGFTLNNKLTQVTTAADGTFSTKIGMGIGLSLLGSQNMAIRVQPQEPWNAPLTTSKGIFIINWMVTGIILILLVFISVYLPRRFKKWFGAFPAKRPVTPDIVTAPVPRYVPGVAAVSGTNDAINEKEERANPILYWYRTALRFVQSLTKKMMKPQQTLREYARDTGRLLGPAGKYFEELTLIFEKHLYGGGKKTAETDGERSKRLAEAVKESNK